MLNPEILRRAQALAKQPYQARIFLDETTEGEPVYVALVPEMPGCHTHGDTEEEAREWLESAKVDFIYFLLADGLDVPAPQEIGHHVSIDMSEFSGCRDDSILTGSDGSRVAIMQGQPVETG